MVWDCFFISPALTIKFYGGHSKEDPPVPIPNTEVKLFSADGTARATVWESRSSPYFYTKSPNQRNLIGAFVFLYLLICHTFSRFILFTFQFTFSHFLPNLQCFWFDFTFFLDKSIKIKFPSF